MTGVCVELIRVSGPIKFLLEIPYDFVPDGSTKFASAAFLRFNALDMLCINAGLFNEK